MSVELRHYCRNLKCRSKLPAPIENVRKAFCCRGCHSAFYRTRCVVCEKDTGTNPLTGEKRKRLGQRKFCGRKCKAEARQFPHVYAWTVRRTRSPSSCDKMGLKTGPQPSTISTRGRSRNDQSQTSKKPRHKPLIFRQAIGWKSVATCAVTST